MAFIEREVKIVEWKEKGTKVKGRLENVESVKYSDGGVGLKYKVRTNVNETTEFLGATNLNSKLVRSDIGLMIYVEYMGEDETRQMSGDKNKPKLFKVMVDPASKLTEAGVGDEDIPF